MENPNTGSKMETTRPYKIVVVEPDHGRRNHLRLAITGWGDTAVCFEKVSICLDNLLLLQPDLIVLGQLEAQRIAQFLYAAKYVDFELPVLVITGEMEVHLFLRNNGFVHATAISPAITPEDLKEDIERLKEQIHRTPAVKCSAPWPMIVGTDQEMVRIKKTIFEIARSGESLLVQGESGTGKDLVARAVHFWSMQQHGAFIKVDSGAITQDIFQTDLSKWFAQSENLKVENSSGKKNVSRRHTIFFDEIGKMSIDLQGALLRLFEDWEGSDYGPQSSLPDIRIIASTSNDLEGLTKKGKFRKDLFYRLNVFHIEIPPLRKRQEDIMCLVDFFTDKYCWELGKGHYVLPQRTRSLYTEYEWPGNVRELESIVKSSVIVGDESGFIESLCGCCYGSSAMSGVGGNNLGQGFFNTTELRSYMGDLNNISLKDICREFIARAEKKLMKKALDRTNWNRKKAAVLLNISYKSLLNKIKVYDITA